MVNDPPLFGDGGYLDLSEDGGGVGGSRAKGIEEVVILQLGAVPQRICRGGQIVDVPGLVEYPSAWEAIEWPRGECGLPLHAPCPAAELCRCKAPHHTRSAQEDPKDLPLEEGESFEEALVLLAPPVALTKGSGLVKRKEYMSDGTGSKHLRDEALTYAYHLLIT